jgi:hypothetical protein
VSETKHMWSFALHRCMKSENKLNELKKAIVYGEKRQIKVDDDVIEPSRIVRLIAQEDDLEKITEGFHCVSYLYQ